MHKRQDRRLAASQQDASAALLSRDDRYRELLQMLQEKRARWELLGERMSLYERALLPAWSKYSNLLNCGGTMQPCGFSRRLACAYNPGPVARAF